VSADASRRRGGIAAALLVAAVGLGHRIAIFVAHRAALDAQVDANPLWYTGQHLPLPMLRDHLVTALVLLQQTPPLSNLLLGLIAKAMPGPHALVHALIALQAALSIGAAVVLQRLLAWAAGGRLLGATLVSLAFVLDTDLVVLEYNSLGQTFYENLGMLLAVAFALALCRVADAGRVRDAARAGVFAGLLALTRATWSFVAAPAALFVALVTPRRRAATLAFLAPVLLLHGGWVTKNAVVYGRLTPATSSWTGYNLYNGLRRAGLEEPFRRFVIARGDPSWLVEMVDPPQLLPWPRTPPAVPEARDRAIAAWSGLDNPLMNSATAAVAFGELERAFSAFAWAHPALVLEKMARAYRLFWLPPAAYGRMYLALFCLDDGVPGGLDPAAIVAGVVAHRLPPQAWETSGTYPALARRPARLWTLRWLEPAWLLAETSAVHVLVPLLGVAWAIRRLRGGGALDPAVRRRALAIVVCWTLVGYVALVSSIGELGENMRFRLGAEPLVWTVTVLAWAEAARLVRGRQNLRKWGGADVMPRTSSG